MAVETEIERMVVRLIGDSQSYMKMMKDAEDQAGKTASVVETHTKKMENMSKALKSFGSSASMYLTAPISGLGAVASYEFGKYQAALTKITSMVLISKEDVEEYSKSLKLLAIETGKSPTELAEALENITSSNVKGEEAMNLLTIAAKAGAAGLGEVRSVTVAATTAMNVFKGQNLSASDAVNILTRAVQEGSAEAEAFAPVIGDVAQAANALGLDFSTAAGMVAFLSRTAGSAGQAATQAKGLMLQILRLKPEGKAAEALEAIGFSADKLREKIRGSGDLVGAMNELDAALKANGMTMNQVFTDSEALMGALSIVGDNAQSAADVMANVRTETDSVGTAFDAVADTSKIKMAQVAAEAKINMIELGEMLVNVRDITINMTHHLQDAWKNTDEETKKYLITLALVLAAIGPISMALGKLVGVFVMLSKAITAIGTAIAFATGKGIMLLAYGAAATLWVAVFVAGVYVLTKAFSALIEKVMGYNKAIREGLELSSLLEDTMGEKRNKSQTNVLAQSAGMQGEDKRSFLAEELEQAKKNAEGYEGQVRGATAEVERLSGVWNRWTGNKVLEVAKADLEEVQARAKASKEWVGQLEEELNNLPAIEEQKQQDFSNPIDPEVQEEVDKLTESMKFQAETIGMTAREIEIYKLKQQGALTGLLEILAAEEKARIQSEETAKSAKDLTDSLHLQAATMHMTSTEAEVYKLKQKGLTEEQEKSIRVAAKIVEANEKHKAFLDKAKNLTEQYMTVEEKFKKGQKELQEMLDGGHISLDVYNQALADLQKQTDKDYSVDLSPKGIDALEAGSAEALAALENYRSAMKGGPSLEPDQQLVVDSVVPQQAMEVQQQHAGPPPMEAVDHVKNMMRDMNQDRTGSDISTLLQSIKVATEKTAEKEPIQLAEAGL